MTESIPVGIHATSQAALAYTPPKSAPGVSDKHIAAALDQLAEQLQLRPGEPSFYDQAQLDLIEQVDARAEQLALMDAAYRAQSTKYLAVAVDACSLLIEMQSLIAKMNWFTSGASTLVQLQDCAERAIPIIANFRRQQ